MKRQVLGYAQEDGQWYKNIDGVWAEFQPKSAVLEKLAKTSGCDLSKNWLLIRDGSSLSMFNTPHPLD